MYQSSSFESGTRYDNVHFSRKGETTEGEISWVAEYEYVAVPSTMESGTIARAKPPTAVLATRGS
jgi:hypothetical protein